MTENEISYQIRGAIYDTFNEFGPGLLESVYVEALCFYLTQRGLKTQKEVPIPVFIGEHKLSVGFRIDILVEGKVIIEVKSVEDLARVHHKQVLTYLKLANKKLGILVNFNTDNINHTIFRKVNHL